MVIFSKRKVAVCVMAALAAQVMAAQAANKEDVIVVTTASGFQQKIEDAPASISVISREQLENKAYRDVTDALKDVPGVLVTGGGSSSDISIRGMDAKYTMILVDGKRVDTRGTRPNSDNSGIEQGWLPPLTAIDRIEVVRGPMSSLYGSDAMGGVINIITRKIQEKWVGSVRAETTLTERKNEGNSAQSSLYAAGPLIDGKLGMKVNALYSHRGEDRIIDGFNRQIIRSGGGTLSWTPDEQNTFDFDFKADRQNRDYHQGKSSESGNGYERYERTNYALTHDGIYDWGNINTFVQRDESKNPGRQMKYTDTLVKNQTVFNFDAHTLSIGGQYRYEDLKDDSSNQMEGGANALNRYSWALFAEDDWALTNDFNLTGGLRMDKDENFGSHWTPRIYGVWHIDEMWTLKGGVSAGYRSPDLRQVSPNWGQITGGSGSAIPAIILGNADLKPEKSVTEEIGIIWNNQDNLNLGLTIYQTDFKDKITEERDCTANDKTGEKCIYQGKNYKFISKRENVDKARIIGAEATMNWDIIDNLDLAANYTFTDSEQRSGDFTGKPLNKLPKHMGNATLTWNIDADWETWTRYNFRGKTSDYRGRRGMSDGTPSYGFMDIGASYKAWKDVTIAAGVYNVFDKRVDSENYGAALDGRRYNIGLNYNF